LRKDEKMFVEKVIFVKDLVDGAEVTIPLLVKSCNTYKTKSGFPYLHVELMDSSDKIVGKVWDDSENQARKLVKGSVVLLHGHVTNYRGERQLTIKTAVPVASGNYDPSDYRPKSDKNASAMFQELLALIDSMEDQDFRNLTRLAITHPRSSFFTLAPAAKHFHHAYASGLLEHTLSVAKLAKLVSLHYGELLNASLLLAGAVLHDIGKIFEFTKDPDTDYTTLGRLWGHLSYGAMYITELSRELPNFPQEKLLLLQHMLLSHHGEAKMGSPITPKILEAIVLHFLDDLDGKLFGVSAFIESEVGKNPNSQPGWTGYNKLLDSFYLKTPDFLSQMPHNTEGNDFQEQNLSDVIPTDFPLEPPFGIEGEQEIDYRSSSGPQSSSQQEPEIPNKEEEPILSINEPKGASTLKDFEEDSTIETILQPIKENAEEQRPIKKTPAKVITEDEAPNNLNRLF
jgi:3'-5' exoribonuclease